MADTLTVHLSRDELHDVDPETSAFETDGTFDVEFVNHGRAAHVHVHPDDALARGVAVTEPNIYVETETSRRVEVTVPEGPRPLRGSLDVSAGYGATTESVDVGLVESPEPAVPMDETLAEPSADSGSTRSLAALADDDGLPVLALGGVAAVVAVAAAFAIGDAVVAAGALVVLVGVAAAVYALASE